MHYFYFLIMILFIKAGPEAYVVLENVNYTSNETQ